ncbi:MAG: hypothetical protein AAGG68_25465 [Bacteroidota bacterium]
MNNYISIFILLLTALLLSNCAPKTISLTSNNLEIINRDRSLISETDGALLIGEKIDGYGTGIAIIRDVDFDEGKIELDIKGENAPGRSFVGLAFNIQNDTTYEAIYFRPFNFQSEEQIRREHSVQYISMPKNDWRYLRTNFEGQYEAEFPRQPNPDDWFAVSMVIDDQNIVVYDEETGTQLLSVGRLEKQMSDQIGFWVGTKGAFRNLRVKG